MTALKNKIDFALVFTVRNANPNGDPLDGNRPRTTYKGLGEVSDVCLKRKIRNRLLDEGYNWGYSCLTMIDKETIGILYESSVAHITFQSIKLKDIIK